MRGMGIQHVFTSKHRLEKASPDFVPRASIYNENGQRGGHG
jgi:hypothetical protein